MLSAIEIYNKPRIEYRDECFVILFINAWELLLKAILSKNRKSIYYPKRRKAPYKTLSLADSLNRSTLYFPNNVPFLPIKKNILLLNVYRDNTIHFYNAPGFRSLIYALARTGIHNYTDLAKKKFGFDFSEEINWQILPLGIKPPIDPISYLRSPKEAEKSDPAIKEFIIELKSSVEELQNANEDIGRLLTIFDVKLESEQKSLTIPSR